MARLKKYRLLWIRVLMVISQVMLVIIVTNWLYAQYRERTAQLNKDLQQALNDVQQQHIDSVITGSFVKPIIAKAKISSSQNATITIHPGPGVMPPPSNLRIHDVRDSIRLQTLKDSLISLPNIKREFRFDLFRKDTDVVYRSTKTPSAEMAGTVLKMVFQELLLDDSVGKEMELKPDTAWLNRAFTAMLHQRGQYFDLRWSTTKRPISTGDKEIILLNNTYFSTAYSVAVSGYQSYVLRKLTPQILFVLFLLGTTVSAFLFTYNTLRQQIRLSTMKDEFIGNMSHELKTPISTVKVALEAINGFNPINDNQTTRDYLRMATLETERLELLVNRVLNTSLLESGKIALHKEPHDIAALVNTTLQAMQVRFKQANAQVRLHVNATDTTTDVDILHLQGVLINLLDNSLKYNAGIPVIDITVAHDGARLTLSVTDNGPGIPTEYTDRVFDKFFRVPTGDRHNVKGYGLGLSYVKQITEQHGGNITVKNNEKGCTFTITLPKA